MIKYYCIGVLSASILFTMLLLCAFNANNNRRHFNASLVKESSNGTIIEDKNTGYIYLKNKDGIIEPIYNEDHTVKTTDDIPDGK